MTISAEKWRKATIYYYYSKRLQNYALKLYESLKG